MNSSWEELNKKINKEASIIVYSYQPYDFEWDWESCGDWDAWGSCGNGGIDRYFPSENQMRGSVKYLKKEFQIMVDYFTMLNNNGKGRYDLHVHVDYDDDDPFIMNWRIDNNRSLDLKLIRS